MVQSSWYQCKCGSHFFFTIVRPIKQSVSIISVPLVYYGQFIVIILAISIKSFDTVQYILGVSIVNKLFHVILPQCLSCVCGFWPACGWCVCGFWPPCVILYFHESIGKFTKCFCACMLPKCYINCLITVLFAVFSLKCLSSVFSHTNNLKSCFNL